jgi:hypothetical protein
MEAGVEFFILIFQEGVNTQLYKLAPAMLPKLFHMFAQPEVILCVILAVLSVPRKAAHPGLASNPYIFVLRRHPRHNCS